MTLNTNNYGNFTTYQGTLAEVMGALKGTYDIDYKLLAFEYDTGNSNWVAVVKTEA